MMINCPKFSYDILNSQSDFRKALSDSPIHVYTNGAIMFLGVSGNYLYHRNCFVTVRHFYFISDIPARGGGGGHSQTEVVGPTHARPSTSKLDPKWRNPWCQNLPLNGVENVKSTPEWRRTTQK